MMLPPTSIMVLLQFQVGLSICVISKCALQDLERTQQLLVPFEGEHLEQVWTSRPTPISPKGKPRLIEDIWFTHIPPSPRRYDRVDRKW
jgi:hypothetical protein